MGIVVDFCVNLWIVSMSMIDLMDALMIYLVAVSMEWRALAGRYRKYDHDRMFIVFHFIFMILFGLDQMNLMALISMLNSDFFECFA